CLRDASGVRHRFAALARVATAKGPPRQNSPPIESVLAPMVHPRVGRAESLGRYNHLVSAPTEGRRCRSSIAQGAAVLARIGSPGEHSAMPIDPNRLAATKRFRCANNPMAQSFKIRHGGVRNTELEVIDAGVMKGTREIERILHIHTEI